MKQIRRKEQTYETNQNKIIDYETNQNKIIDA